MRRTRTSRLIAVFVALAIAFFGGVAVGHLELWPFAALSKLYRLRGARLAETRSEAAFVGLKALDTTSLRRVSTPQRIIERRTAVIDYIWPKTGFPSTRMPDSVNAAFKDPTFQLDNSAGMTRLVTVMRYAVVSASYVLTPKHDRSCLLVYFHSHGQDVRTAGVLVDRLLGAGCTVIAFSTPLTRGSPATVVHDSVLGDIPIRGHNALPVLASQDFSPIAYFVEPVAAALNFVLARRAFPRVGMIGFSGGGWVTTLYAALDERIRSSYPIAGSEPLWLMARRPEGWLDYEQTDIGLYRRANYPELYVMAASDGRDQIQVLNRYDACCFYGRAYRFYEPAVQAIARQIGGSFRVYLDQSHREHKASALAIDSVLVDFFRQRGSSSRLDSAQSH